MLQALVCVGVLMCVVLLQGPILPREYRVKSFLGTGGALETPAEQQLYLHIRAGLIKLLGARKHFAARVPTPYCYTLGR